MNTDELLLIDFSSLARPIWESATTSEARANVADAIVSRVHALAIRHPHAAICMDSGRSFRHDIDPSYKGQRPETEAAMRHQFNEAGERLRRDGFPVWTAKGFEADDIIATATRQALDIADTTVLIASSDKDLLQLVNDRVKAKSIRDGSLADWNAVVERFKVMPTQIRDYLSLVGDSSDNVKGADKIGPVNAAQILKEFGSLDDLFAAFDKGATPTLTPTKRTALQELRGRIETVRALLTLRTDVEIPFAEIAAERTPSVMEEVTDMETGEPIMVDVTHEQPRSLEDITPGQIKNALGAPKDASIPTAAEMWKMTTAPIVVQTPKQQQDAAISAALSSQVVPYAPAPVAIDHDKQLEPRNITEAITLAKHMFDSRLFSAYGNAQSVLSTILAGRELGMTAMASLRNFHIIDGKPTLSAGAIQGLVLSSRKAKYFRCAERTAERATFETQRGDDPPVSLTFTVEDAKLAWTKSDQAWNGSGWKRNPADMCVARAGSKLARLVFPDVVAGLYVPEEME